MPEPASQVGAGLSQTGVCGFVVDEINLPRVLLRALAGRPTLVLGSNPATAIGGKAIKWTIGWMERHWRVIDIRQLVPQASRFWKIGRPDHLGWFFDWVERCDGRLDPDFATPRIRKLVPDYAAAIRSAVGNHYGRHIYLMLMLRDLERGFGAKCVVRGIEPEIATYFSAYFGTPPQLTLVKGWRPRLVINLAQVFAVGILTLARIALSLRLVLPSPISVLMGVDAAGAHARDLTLVDDLVCGEGEVLMVARNREVYAECRGALSERQLVCRQDGISTPGQAAKDMVQVLTDLIALYRACGGLSPRLARTVFGFVYWRIAYRALFRRYAPRFFLGRDDYTPEHHMRSQELRRVGGVPFGIMHGIAWTGTHAGYQNIDFDHYFLYGESSGFPWLRRHWPAHMQVHVIGTWGMTRQERDALPAPAERPPDILVMTSDAPGGTEAALAVREIAAAFPDRTIYFRPKKKRFPGIPALDATIADLFARPPANVVLATERSYAILGRVRYAFSSATSMIGEAIQYGVQAFALDRGFDGHPERWPMLYKSVPGLCVTTAREFIERVCAIESGTWRYPVEQAAPFIDLSGRDPFDSVRKALGLAQPAVRVQSPDVTIAREPTALTS